MTAIIHETHERITRSGISYDIFFVEERRQNPRSNSKSTFLIYCKDNKRVISGDASFPSGLSLDELFDAVISHSRTMPCPEYGDSPQNVTLMDGKLIQINFTNGISARPFVATLDQSVELQFHSSDYVALLDNGIQRDIAVALTDITRLKKQATDSLRASKPSDYVANRRFVLKNYEGFERKFDQEITTYLCEQGLQGLAFYNFLADTSVGSEVQNWRRRALTAYPLLAGYIVSNRDIIDAISYGRPLNRALAGAVICSHSPGISLAKAARVISRIENVTHDQLGNDMHCIALDLLVPMAQIEPNFLPATSQFNVFVKLIKGTHAASIARLVGYNALAREAAGQWEEYLHWWQQRLEHQAKIHDPFGGEPKYKVTQWIPGQRADTYFDLFVEFLIIPALKCLAVNRHGMKLADAQKIIDSERLNTKNHAMKWFGQLGITPRQLVQAVVNRRAKDEAIKVRIGAAAISRDVNIEWEPFFRGTLRAPNGLEIVCIHDMKKHADVSLCMDNCIASLITSSLVSGVDYFVIKFFGESVSVFQLMCNFGANKVALISHLGVANAQLGADHPAHAAVSWLMNEIMAGKYFFARPKIEVSKCLARLEVDKVRQMPPAFESETSAFCRLYEHVWKDLFLLPPKLRKDSGGAFLDWLYEQPFVQEMFDRLIPSDAALPTARRSHDLNHGPTQG